MVKVWEFTVKKIDESWNGHGNHYCEGGLHQAQCTLNIIFGSFVFQFHSFIPNNEIKYHCNIVGLEQGKRNPIPSVLELLLSCASPSISSIWISWLLYMHFSHMMSWWPLNFTMLLLRTEHLLIHCVNWDEICHRFPLFSRYVFNETGIGYAHRPIICNIKIPCYQ